MSDKDYLKIALYMVLAIMVVMLVLTCNNPVETITQTKDCKQNGDVVTYKASGDTLVINERVTHNLIIVRDNNYNLHKMRVWEVECIDF